MRAITISALLLVGAAWFGCTSSRAVQDDGSVRIQAGALPSGGALPTATMAPFTIVLERVGTGPVVELRAVLNVVGRAPAPIVLTAVPGPGTVLEAGLAREELGVPAAGTRVERTFRIAADEPTLVVRAVAESRAAAATATAGWPAVPVPEVLRPAAEPIVPVKVGGVVIRQAVPLTPDAAQPESEGSKSR